MALPDPLPFSGVKIERLNSRYFATFDLEELIKTARDDLAETDQEAFKVLLLSSMVGLRRKEIDLLPWSVQLEREYHSRRAHAALQSQDRRQRRRRRGRPRVDDRVPWLSGPRTKIRVCHPFREHATPGRSI